MIRLFLVQLVSFYVKIEICPILVDFFGNNLLKFANQVTDSFVIRLRF